MPAFVSDLFRAVTRARPEQVWAALTTTGSPVAYLYGMTVESGWSVDGAVTMTLDHQWRLTGEVLVAEPFRRLSYTLGERPGGPSVYVNWELRTSGGLTYARLYVDEFQPPAGAGDELEAAWLPVLCGLVTQLDQAATAG
ncbi:MAG: SRPBCC domain-containing protein [Streptosporangiaceae bacterium]